MRVPAFFLTLLMFSFFAHAGAISGGGGKSVAISVNGVKKIELLDLWEATQLYGRTLASTTGDLSKDVDAALINLKNSIPFQMGGCPSGANQDCMLEFLRAKAAKFLKPDPDVKRLKGVKLKLTDDSYEFALPENCAHDSCVVQIVNYQPDGTIWIDQDSYDKMDEVDQAALIAHEALYAFLRAWENETNSIRTRRAIGFAFSGQTFVLASDLVLPKSYVVCVTETRIPTPITNNQNYLYVYLNSSHTIVFAQSLFNGSALMASPLPPAQASLDWKIYSDLAAGTCSSDNSTTTWISHFNGPIEIDRQATYWIDCKRGQVPVVGSNYTPPGTTHEVRLQYTCIRE